MRLTAVLLLGCLFMTQQAAAAVDCLVCHKSRTPGIVSDWQMSKHAQNDVTCATCHGDRHSKTTDFANAEMPTPSICGQCHEERVAQFSRGKHAAAWAAQNAMPATHFQPMALISGMKGCGGCHKIGLKSDEDMKALKADGAGYGVASCDACHTRHTFSLDEARQPQACQTCHMGFDHPQWEMYSSSKHGVRHLLKQNKTLPETAMAPRCQDCHMPDGNHEVRTAWGFLAVRLPMPEDKQWASDRAVILQALGVLDPTGKPTARLEVVKAADVARLTQEAWQVERDKMVKVCSKCHSSAFALTELSKGDDMIRQADREMAQAITIVADLYKDGIIPKPASYSHAFPDLLTFSNTATVVEQKLFVMFLEHRMRAFQGSFHMNPDYAFWYGWNEMTHDLAEIRELAESMRAKKGK